MENMKAVSLAIFLILVSVMFGARADVSYSDAIKKGEVTKDVSECEKITKGRNWGDYFSSVESVRQDCRVEVAAKTGRNNYCNSLPKGFDQFTCLESFARIKLDPKFCTLATEDIFESKEHKASAALYRDRCRAKAISKPEQCRLIFETPHWKEDAEKECFNRLAVNLNDPKWCEKDLPQRRSQCLQRFNEFNRLPKGP
ncbi:MAG: hypothetical protein ABL888_20615 [Pirellulaceae bacterium]